LLFSRIEIIVVLTLIVGFGACSTMEKHYQNEYCNYDAAFKRGMKDASQEQPMDPSISSLCSPVSKISVVRGYRDGYSEAKKNPISAMGDSLFARLEEYSQRWGCVEAFGERKCGFNCVISYGKIHCARKPDHNCIEAFGFVKCGLNCKKQFDRVTCEGT